MLRLSAEQLELLEQLSIRRHGSTAAAALAEAWPLVTQRLGERWPAFVEAALLQGRRHGLGELAELTGYAGLWCLWGSSFDDKPGFDWAREILGDATRSAPLKLHQLLHRSRDELRRRQPAGTGATAAPVVTLAQFDAALAKLAERIAVQSLSRTVFVDSRPKPVVTACDVGSVDLMVAEAKDLQEYRRTAGGWQRAAIAPLAVPASQWTQAPDLPVVFAVTSHAPGSGPAAHLNLKLHMEAACDPKVHPGISHTGGSGRIAWKGRDAARLSVALHAPALPPAAPGSVLPGIAAPLGPDLQQLTIAACGYRDAGAPFGEAKLALQVYPATQWLSEVQHPSWLPMTWPSNDALPPSVATCRLEADGAARDARALSAGWAGLQVAFRQGMERLFNAWSRALDGQAVRLEVEASALMGQAGLTWGWRRVDASTVQMRSEGALDLIACAVDLRMAGEIVQGPARARVRLACKGRSELRMGVAQLGDQAEPGQDLKSAQRSWRFPFSIEVEPLATAGLATLFAAPTPEPMRGALAGECGLRPRADGAGWQWFFTVRLEPVTVSLACADPVVGSAGHTRALLAAMPLVDWSAG